MPSLQNVLGSIPGLAGYAAGQEEDRTAQLAQVRQMGGLQAILESAQKQQMQRKAMQDEQVMRGVVQQAGGDPRIAIEKLMATGHPKAIELATKMQEAFGNKQGQAIGAGGLRLPDGTIVPPAARPGGAGSGLAKLMAERDALPEGDPRRATYDNAIRKESETARQISPTIINPAPVSTIVVKDPSSSTGWSYKDARTGKITSQDAPPPAGDPSRNYGGAVATAAGKDDVAQHDAAIVAGQDLPKINNLVSTIKNSQAITGLGADILKNVERAKVLLANDKKAGKVVSDTEYLDALMGSEVFSMIKPLGIGARGLDTPAEREFLRKVLTGEISLNKDTLLRMAETRKAITERAVERWNKRVKSGELDPYFRATGRQKNEVGLSADQPTTVPPTPASKSGSGGFKITPIN